MPIIFSALQTRLQDWAENTATEFTGLTSNIINLAEEQIQQDADIAPFRTVTATLSTATAALALPTTVVIIDWLRVAGADYLDLKDESFIREFQPTATYTGTPRFYSYYSGATQVQVSPTPTGTTTFEAGYTQRITPLGSTASSNWISNNAEQVLTAACMMIACDFMKSEVVETERWTKHYNEALGRLIAEHGGRRRNPIYRGGDARRN